MGMSEETRKCELEHAARLASKQRGDIAEMAFMRKAAAMGFSVAKPWADGERYDFVVRSGKVFWRVQVKSVRSLNYRRKHYRVSLAGSQSLRYTADEIDFLVAYIFPEDAWFVFPASVVENRASICIAAKSKFQQYREAWKLMECAVAQSVAGGKAPNDPGAAPRSTEDAVKI